MAVGFGYSEVKKRYDLTHLTPDNLPRPVAECTIPKDAFAIFLGDHFVTYTTYFPHTVIAIGKDDSGRPYPLLRINKHEEIIGIDILRIFDVGGLPITSVHEDKPWENSSFRVTVDAHELAAYDNEDNQVLFLHFLNPRTLYVTGVFRRPGRFGVYVENVQKDRIYTEPHKFTLHSGCFSGGGDAVDFLFQ
jgi:hypothetical protein